MKPIKITEQIAKHLREVFFGGNWTSSSLREQLVGINWETALTKHKSLNTIAALVFHIGYYITAVIPVLQGGTLDAKDTYSFNHPSIQSAEDWEKLLLKTWTDAETLAILIEQLPEHRLWENFTDEKYGSYYRNLHGIIEHAHYHLGQIVLIKKLRAAPPGDRNEIQNSVSSRYESDQE